MFFLPVLAVVIAAPQVMNLANRVLEEYIIPRKAGIRALGALDRGERIWAIGFDLAITDGEMIKLKTMGAKAILDEAASRHCLLTQAGQAEVCTHCQRLQG